MVVTTARLAQPRIDADAQHDIVVERIKALLPLIRDEARAAEEAEEISPKVMAAVEEAGLFEIMVPRVYGGMGLGIKTLMATTRLLSTADTSVAWIVTFLIEHNWWICRMPREVQERLYADRGNVKMATAQGYDNRAEVEGNGFRFSGRYPYCSGVMQASHVLLPGMVHAGQGPEPHMFLVPVEEVEILDDWKVSGMRSTGSRTVIAKDVYASRAWSIPAMSMFSARNHYGVYHEEPIFRAALGLSLLLGMSAYALGSAESCVDIFKARLPQSRPFGVARLDRPLSRVRWAEAHQSVRQAGLLFEKAVADLHAKAETGADWSMEEVGQIEFDCLTITHVCKDAIRRILDGSGSSAFHLDNPLQRFMRDIDMLATHALSSDYDVIADRAARQLLGLGRTPEDPPLPL